MSTTDSTQDKALPEEPRIRLERVFIEAYLRTKGHTLQSLAQLPEEEARRLMTEASIYASTRLAETETRERLLQELHGTSQV